MKSMKPLTDADLAERAEGEAECQLAIVRALKPLSQDQRQRVMEAVSLLHQAEALVPGILDLIARPKQK